MRFRNIVGPVLLAGLLLAPGVTRSEVAVESGAGPQRGFVILSGPDDPVPWPSFGRIRQHVDPLYLLNEWGDANGDGPPSAATNPTTGYPEVVWALWDGADYEIALSRWDGAQWTTPEMLTDNGVDDVDPAIACTAAGGRQIGWRRAGSPEQVWWTELAPGEPLAPEERVSFVVDGGARPSTAAIGNLPWVAYQVAIPGATQVLVAARAGAVWEREIVQQTAYPGPHGDGDIGIGLHSAGARLWVEWIEGPGLMGFREYEPASETWSDMETEPYTWGDNGQSESFARELARARIRLRVLSP